MGWCGWCGEVQCRVFIVVYGFSNANKHIKAKIAHKQEKMMIIIIVIIIINL